MTPRRQPAAHSLRSDAEQNREQVVRAAISALHRDGPAVPMARIAADAGVGIGTVYRHFRNRDELLEELTHRSFALMLRRMDEAREVGGTAVDVLRAFLTAVVADRDDLVLRSTGGPAVESERTRAVQAELHRAIRELIARGADDGTIARDIDVFDIAWLGATLAQPGRGGRSWARVSERLLETYLAGLGVSGP